MGGACFFFFTSDRRQQQVAIISSSNCCSWLPRQGGDGEEEVERASPLQVPASLSLLSLSRWPQNELVFTASSQKHVIFFSSCWVSESLLNVRKMKMKRNRSVSISAPTADEPVTGVWLLRLSNPENNHFFYEEMRGEGEEEEEEEEEGDWMIVSSKTRWNYTRRLCLLILIFISY